MPVDMIVKSAPVKESAANLSASVTTTLRSEIISGRLPPGKLVAEIPTAERLKVSRVPVRESLLRLEREGLLVFNERGRGQVRRLAYRDYQEICDVRVMLESESFRLAALKRTDLHIQHLLKNIATMEKAKTLTRVTLLDIEFHSLVMEAADHSRLTHLWQMMLGQVQLFTANLQRVQHAQAHQVREATVAAHRQCLDLITSREANRASDLICHHLQSWRDLVIQHRAALEANV